jgi:hypothetical protein
MIVRAAVALIAVFMASTAGAQMPGAPVLQNAWAAPGLVVALDMGGGSGGGTTWAAAAGWTPAAARFQLSGGGGVGGSGGGVGSSNRGVYGLRAAVPIKQLMAGDLGLAAFAGIGGGAGNKVDTTVAKSIVPAGLAIGYRKAIGAAGRGFSVYADPAYEFFTGAAKSHGYVRVGVGIDAGITARLGLTVGAESGATAAPGTVGPRGTLYGIGISMKVGG